MYSWEINQILEKNNFIISEKEYKRISNVKDSPQIIDVKYDTYSDSFRMSTNDGYLWQFQSKKI